VSDATPVIQSDNGNFSASINPKQISEVPNPGNDLTYFAQTAPGMVMNTDFAGSGNGNFSSLGMPGTSNLFRRDGMNIDDNELNTNITGPSNLLLGQNEIQEATVVSIGYSGQYGGAAGANVNYLTKSGEAIIFTEMLSTYGMAVCSMRPRLQQTAERSARQQ
jgi:hypothetical protein